MSVSLGEESKTYFGGRRHPYLSRIEGRAPPHPCQVEWCAFFADVDHEIHTVEEGIRITATYLLRRKDHTSAAALIPRCLQGQAQANSIRDCLLESLRDSR